jgi:hypothetical protein
MTPYCGRLISRWLSAIRERARLLAGTLAGTIWTATGVGVAAAAPAVPVVYTQVRAISIGIQVGATTFLAREPGLVSFVNDVGIGYAQWEDALPNRGASRTRAGRTIRE